MAVPPPKVRVIQSTGDVAVRLQLVGLPVAANVPTPPLAVKVLAEGEMATAVQACP